MHCVLEGIAKKLCSLWLDSTNSGKRYYISSHSAIIDQRLMSIKPPETVARTPRAITNRKRWKGLHIYKQQLCCIILLMYLSASEFRAWITFYSLPVLEGILPNEYLEHLSLLVCSVHFLLSDKITPDMLRKAKEMLESFYLKFQCLYGEYVFAHHYLKTYTLL